MIAQTAKRLSGDEHPCSSCVGRHLKRTPRGLRCIDVDLIEQLYYLLSPKSRYTAGLRKALRSELKLITMDAV